MKRTLPLKHRSANKLALKEKVLRKLKEGWYLDSAGQQGLAGWIWTDGKKGFSVPVWLMNDLVSNGEITMGDLGWWVLDKQPEEQHEQEETDQGGP